MDHVLTSFIRALRNADVRVSTAETLDAFNTVQLVGYAYRELLKHSLALVLPKTQDEKALFDATFDQFFTLRQSAALDLGAAQPAFDTESLDDAEPSAAGAPKRC